MPSTYFILPFLLVRSIAYGEFNSIPIHLSQSSQSLNQDPAHRPIKIDFDTLCIEGVRIVRIIITPNRIIDLHKIPFSRFFKFLSTIVCKVTHKNKNSELVCLFSSYNSTHRYKNTKHIIVIHVIYCMDYK